MPVKLISSVSLTSNIAEITTATSHGLSVGDYLTINGVNATFDGSFTVLDVSSSVIFTYNKISSNVPPIGSSGSVIYAQISNPKPAYMYDKTTDSWFPISGQIDTSKNYIWNGSQLFESTAQFESPVSFNSISTTNSASVGSNLQVSGSANFNSEIKINGGINVYTTASARNSAISSPSVGTMTYISGTKKLEIWDGTAWDQVLTVDQ